jgi:hypothetical protein
VENELINFTNFWLTFGVIIVFIAELESVELSKSSVEVSIIALIFSIDWSLQKFYRYLIGKEYDNALIQILADAFVVGFEVVLAELRSAEDGLDGIDIIDINIPNGDLPVSLSPFWTAVLILLDTVQLFNQEG